MQFHVYLPRLLAAADRLEESARRQRRALAELTGTLVRLRRLSYMEGPLRQLRRRADQLEERLQATLRMAQTLRRIHEGYSRMEREAADGLDFPVRPLSGIDPGQSTQHEVEDTPMIWVEGVDLDSYIAVPDGLTGRESLLRVDIRTDVIRLRGTDALTGAAPVELLAVELPAGLTLGTYVERE